MTVANTTYKFKNWTLDKTVDIHDTSNFDSTDDCKENVAGMRSATLSLEGPYDQGVMLFVEGTSYTFVLSAGTSTFTVAARVKNVKPVTDTDNVVRVSVEAVSTGSFTAGLPS